jgi:ElaB/YqjD/DUF883 family membrane-anchored ribosome-binding protein
LRQRHDAAICAVCTPFRNKGVTDMTAADEIARLRRKVEELIAERGQSPINRAQQTATERLSTLVTQVRDRPLTAVLVAAGLGYVIARLTRRHA